jgi:Rhodopirellula transposase DDE domain
VPAGRVRAAGAGRPQAQALNPELVPALERLVDPDTRGDPEPAPRWTTRSTADLADALTGAGHPVSPDTVGRLLKQGGYSPRGDAKTIEGKRHADRDARFRYINDKVRQFQHTGDPVISVDTKKKELVGDYKTGAGSGSPAGRPEQVNVHDFKGELGEAVPYGVYDVAADTGWIDVG